MNSLWLLFRVPLSILNAVSAVAGALLFQGRQNVSLLIFLSAAVALLAAGASALNQLLEVKTDAVMERTAGRPLPCRTMTRLQVLVLAISLLCSGFVVLLAIGGKTAALLALTSLLCYLGVYTPMKRCSSLSLVFGAVSGALPPFIGWHVAGGALLDFRIILFAGILYLWQIPHFWLLQARHADEYRRAGIPVFYSSAIGFKWLDHTLLWIAALVAAAMLLPVLGVIQGASAIFYVAFLLLLVAISISRFKPALFRCLSLFPLIAAASLLLKSFSG